jgi:ElaB/YqjD/DUF883 family membrane-anchored ribosome-binding protein
MMNQTSKSLRSSAQGYADDAEGAATHALDFASQAIEKAGEKVRELRYGVKDLASRSATSVGDATLAAQKQLREYAQATTRYVADEPVKAALIAAAVGAVVAGLILAMRRDRNE